MKKGRRQTKRMERWREEKEEERCMSKNFPQDLTEIKE